MIHDLLVLCWYAFGFVCLLWVSNVVAGWLLGGDE